MTDRQKDSVFYGPLLGLPLIVVFFSATGSETGLVTFTSVGSILATVLLGLIRCLDRFSRSYLAAAGVSAILISSIALTHWPLRMTFAMARTRLDDIANRGCGGAGFEGYENAGVFTISSADNDASGGCRLPIVRRNSQVEFVRLRGSANIEDIQTVSHLKLNDDWYHVEVPKPGYDKVER